MLTIEINSAGLWVPRQSCQSQKWIPIAEQLLQIYLFCCAPADGTLDLLLPGAKQVSDALALGQLPVCLHKHHLRAHLQAAAPMQDLRE